MTELSTPPGIFPVKMSDIQQPEYGTKEFAIAAGYEGQIQELKHENQLLQLRIQHLEDLRTIAIQNINYLQMLVAKFIDTPETK